MHHLADSEMASAIRIRYLIVEDERSVVGYDKERMLAPLADARASTQNCLEGFEESDCDRFGTYSEYPGKFTVVGWLEYEAEHAHDRGDQIRRSRGPSASCRL